MSFEISTLIKRAVIALLV